MWCLGASDGLARECSTGSAVRWMLRAVDRHNSSSRLMFQPPVPLCSCDLVISCFTAWPRSVSAVCRHNILWGCFIDDTNHLTPICLLLLLSCLVPAGIPGERSWP
jgi:hypothetical protein